MRDGFAKFKKEEPSTLTITDDADGGMSLLPSAGAGKKNRIYSILINTSATKILTFNDLPFSKAYVYENTMLLLDFGFEGVLQSTLATALTIEATGTCLLTYIVRYSKE